MGLVMQDNNAGFSVNVHKDLPRLRGIDTWYFVQANFHDWLWAAGLSSLIGTGHLEHQRDALSFVQVLRQVQPPPRYVPAAE